MKKRLISFLVLGLILTMLPITGFAAEIFNENFESYSVGDHPTTFTTSSTSTGSIGEVASYSGDNSFRIYVVTTSTLSRSRIEEKVFDVNSSASTLTCTFDLTPSSVNDRIGINLTDKPSDAICMLYLYDDLRARGNTTYVNNAFSIGTDYTVRIVLDRAAGTYDVYMNNSILMDDEAAFSAATRTESSLRLMSIADNVGNTDAYFDNVVISDDSGAAGATVLVSNPQTGELSWFEKLFDLFK